MKHAASVDFSRAPFLVIWEMTQACDLVCRHCRANAAPARSPEELTTQEAEGLIRAVREMGTGIFVFSGGDPLKRDDLEHLIGFAKDHAARTGAIPAGSALLTRERIQRLKQAGLDQLALSLDAPQAAEHDALRGAEGSFERTMQAAGWVREAGLDLQINTMINGLAPEALERLMGLVVALGAVFWEIFFLVPVGRGEEMPLATASYVEGIFERIYAFSRRAPLLIKVAEAPHFRRFVFQKDSSQGKDASEAMLTRGVTPSGIRNAVRSGGRIGLSPLTVNAGRGFLFVSHRGDIMPSGFLPIVCGNVRKDPVSAVYRDHALFQALRDPEKLQGRCGRCEYRVLCGGSRSRAYATYGDPFAEDLLCSYIPR
ncbi:MAG: TIGR04053 family radical SAM/SPASM domain-containing protein [Candidatus Omnitrophota bacterium]